MCGWPPGAQDQAETQTPRGAETTLRHRGPERGNNHSLELSDGSHWGPPRGALPRPGPGLGAGCDQERVTGGGVTGGRGRGMWREAGDRVRVRYTGFGGGARGCARLDEGKGQEPGGGCSAVTHVAPAHGPNV